MKELSRKMLTVYVVHCDSSCLLHGCLFIANVWQVEIFGIADKFQFKKLSESKCHVITPLPLWLGLTALDLPPRKDRSSDSDTHLSFLPAARERSCPLLLAFEDVSCSYLIRIRCFAPGLQLEADAL